MPDKPTYEQLTHRVRELEDAAFKHKRTADALREKIVFWESVLKTLSVGITYTKDRKILWANKAMEQLFGFEREAEYIGMDTARIYADQEEYNRIGQMLYDQKNKKKILDFDASFVRKDGTVFDGFVRVNMIDSDDAQQGLIVSIVDITARKQAEEGLREREEFYTRLVATMPDIVVRMDMEGTILFISDAALKIGGYTRQDLEGRNMLTFIAPEDQERAIENNIRMLEGKLGPKTYHLLMKDGEKRLFEVNGDVLRTDDGTPYGIVHVMRDITEQRKLERLLLQAHKMEAIGTLAGGIAHDFNNLLMGIQGRASLVSVELDHTHPHKEHLTAIEDYVRSATNLTKQLLGVARGGKYEITATDINHLVAGSAHMFGRTKKEIRIHEKLKPGPIIVAVDRKQIEQVLLNLYINAWQAMPEGGELYLETRRVNLDAAYCQPYQVEPGAYAKISVTDSGIGIEPSIRQQIFDPFFTTKDKTRGTGLGLASAYGIIKNHGGMITVYSEIDHGTTFNIYLPLSDQEAQQGKTEEEDLIKGNETVLLIDDETMILDVGAAMLKKLNYQVISADSGEKAIELIRQADGPINLIILDLIMPGMDGGQTFDRIRELVPELPVIIASGYAMNGKAAGIMDRGANGFIQKPFTIHELSKKVRDVIDSA